MLNRLRVQVRALFRKPEVEQDLDEELRYHLEKETERNIDGGMNPREARQAALRGFGNVDVLKEESRDALGVRLLEEFWQDLCYGARTFLRSPGFTAVALLSLALGIGANTAIFSLVDAVLWKMLPVQDPEQLVFLERFPGRTFGGFKKFCDISYPLMLALRQRDPMIAGATTFRLNPMTALVGGEVEPVNSLWVAESFYSVLGVNAQSGRLIQPGDGREGGVAVLSHGYWQRRFGSQPVIGSSIVLNGAAHTIVGVAPPEFFGIIQGSSFDVSVPIPERDLQRQASSLADPRVPPLLWVIARVRPGVTSEEVSRSLTGLLRQMMLEERSPEAVPGRIEQHRIGSRPASQGLDSLRARFSKPLLALMSLVALVLLITCANVANLMLSRAAARSREMSIRVSIGAGRTRLLRQLLTESLLLSSGGGAVGLLVAHWSASILVQMVSSGDPPIHLLVSLDYRALAFTAGVSVLTGLLFGLAPALKASGAGMDPIFGRATPAARPTSLSRLLVVSQVALSMVLLVGAGLFVRTLQKLTDLDAGFRQENVLLVTLNPQLAGLRGPQVAGLYRQIIERVSAIAGVLSVSFERNKPLSGSASLSSISPPGYVPPPGEELITYFEEVGPRYFETLRMRLIAGRDFLVTDDRDAPKVIAINETAARLYFPGQNPVGKRVGHQSNPTQFEIVGVVRDARHNSLREPARVMAYLPALQDPEIRDTTILVRTSGDPLNLAPMIRQVVREADPKVPVMGVTTLSQIADRSLAQERLTATLASCFGMLALLMAGVGLSGVLSFAVARRTHEIGIRMALGATSSDVSWMVLRESLSMVAIGVVFGLPSAIAAGRVAADLLFGLETTDPPTLVMAVSILAAVALAAAYLPARRAARVDPMVALRYE